MHDTSQIIEISITGYIVACVMGIGAAALVQYFAKTDGLKVIWAQIRMTFQLILMGFVLLAIFNYPNPLVSIIALAVMELFAVLTVLNQHRGKVPKAALTYVALGLVVGSVIATVIFLVGIIELNPLVNPRYLLPTAGMIVGNTMTAMNLAVRALENQVKTQQDMIETALYLGATPEWAVAPLTREAFITALTPTITTMFSLGIVMLPGMMTGQLLSGALPITAVIYQIIIMVGILFSVVISVILTFKLGGKQFLVSTTK